MAPDAHEVGGSTLNSRVFPAQLGATMTEWIWAVVCVTELVVTLQNAFENTKHHL